MKHQAYAGALALLLGSTSAMAGVPEVWEPPAEMSWSNPVEGGVDGQPWWVSYNDQRLGELIDEGISENGDAAATMERVRQAEAVAVQVRAGLLPQVAATGSIAASPAEAFLFQIGQSGPVPEDFPTALYSGSAFLTASYPIDIWGRTILSTRATNRSAHAAAADLANFRMALSTQIGEAYFDVLAAQEQLKVVQSQLEISENLLELMELRYEGGQVTGLDVLQQRGSLASAQSQLPQTQAQLAALEWRLMTLLGRMPNEPLAGIEGMMPDLPAAPAMGVPADLMVNRPDLRAAQKRLESSTDSRRSAAMGYLPSLSASAQYGYQGRTDLAPYFAADAAAQAESQALSRADGDEDDGLFSEWSTQESWNIGLNLNVPIFTGGRTYGAHQAARADEKAQARSLQQLTIQAFGEVESARAREVLGVAQLEAVNAQLEASRMAFENARDRYLAGLDTYLSVLASQNAYRGAELARVMAHRSLLSTRTQLHLALGGPWTQNISD